MTLTAAGNNREVLLSVAQRAASVWLGRDLEGQTDEILKVVCEVMREDPLEVAGDRRFAHLISARHLWWACLRRYRGWSWHDIGDYVDRDHSTVISGVGKIPNALVESIGPLLTTWHQGTP